MRAVAQAHVATGAPVTVHTHPGSRSGLEALRVLGEEGVDLTRVVLGHSGDSADVDHLAELADPGCLLGMDRFGLDILLPLEQRVARSRPCAPAATPGSMVLSHDASCYIDWFSPEQRSPLFAPAWHYQHLFDDVLPGAPRARGHRGPAGHHAGRQPAPLLQRSRRPGLVGRAGHDGARDSEAPAGQHRQAHLPGGRPRTGNTEPMPELEVVAPGSTWASTARTRSVRRARTR